MGLTDRSRLGSIKSRQQRQQRKLERLHRQPDSAPASVSEAPSVSQPSSSAQKQAWEKYLLAKAIYEETREMEHWRYLQKCIAEYEQTLKSNASVKA